MDTQTFLNQLSQLVTTHHKTQKTILSYEEYISSLFEHPARHIRNANEYALDALTHLQRSTNAEHASDFFEAGDENDPTPPVHGHVSVLSSLIQAIDENVKEGVPLRLILLHGPNGSGKSSIIKKLMQALELYSQTEEGALYTFNWVFPNKEYSQKKFGLSPDSDHQTAETAGSYAALPSEHIQSLVRSELNEPPYLLFPKTFRENVWTRLLEDADGAGDRLPLKRFYHYFMQGSLSPRNQKIFEALITEYNGDLLSVFNHVQVQRFFLNRDTLSGLVTIEPMMHADVGLRQITAQQNFQFLPNALKYTDLFALDGELVYGNRGIVEYNDLLKRPIEAFKYLLTTCETGRLQIGSSTLNLDSVLIGSCNDRQLDTFKESPDFSSFNARFLLIRVPLLMNYHDEAKIYDAVSNTLVQNRPMHPNTHNLIALWAVMTRLRRPAYEEMPEEFRDTAEKLSAVDKALLYADDWTNLSHLGVEKARLPEFSDRLLAQYRHELFYEGRIGASPREMKNLILCAIKKYPFEKTVTFQAVLEELRNLTERVTEFDFLRVQPDGDYNTPAAYVETIERLAQDAADFAFRKSADFFTPEQIHGYIHEYITHVTHALRGEKIRDPMTRQMRDPDETLMRTFESRAQVTNPDEFRDRVLNTIAARYIDRPQSQPDIETLFPELFGQISTALFVEQKPKIFNLLKYMLDHDAAALTPEEIKLADRARGLLSSEWGYHHECLDEALRWLIVRYQK